MSRQIDQFFEKTLKASATFLARWRGASAELWQLTYAHKTLTIVLRREGDSGNLVIGCLDPLRIHAPARWTNSDLVISRYPLAEAGEDGFVIIDKKADVEVVTGSVEVKENVKLY